MPFDFALVLNNQLVFCTSESEYPKFELVIFANTLLEQIKDGQPWTLHKLVIHPATTLAYETLLVKRYCSTNGSMELYASVICHAQQGSAYGSQLLDAFVDKILQGYSLESFQPQINTDVEGFQSYCSGVVRTLLRGGDEESGDLLDECSGESEILYVGLSTNGLPISARLFDSEDFVLYDDPQKRELVTNTLSGQLATIAINALIRARCCMSSIQIKTSPTSSQCLFFHFANFGKDSAFTVELLSTGDPTRIKEYFDLIIRWLDSNGIFENEFAGALRQYSPVQEFFNQLQDKW